MTFSVYDSIKELADKYAKTLAKKVADRVSEMKADDTSHYLIYQVLALPLKRVTR